MRQYETQDNCRRAVWGSRSGRLFCGYTPAVSPSALKAMREKIRDLSIRRKTQLSLDEIAEALNPLLRFPVDREHGFRLIVNINSSRS